MGHKHLHELLTEDQEPFHLKNYIADRRSQLKPTAGETALNPRKRKPLIQSSSASTTASNFCTNHLCFFSLQDSQDVTKSPFLGFPSPVIRSPCNIKSPNCNNATVFLHIPSRTAAVLLDASVRIQRNKNPVYKSKPESRISRFGLLGSLFKRLKDRRTRIKRREISLSSPPTSRNRDTNVAGNGSLYDNNIVISADWSEKSSEFGTSCSSSSVHDSEEIDFVGEIDGFDSSDKCFCSSPFRFSLEETHSSGRRTPDFLSPATSPIHQLQQEIEDYQVGKSQEIHVEEEDKEQCSPVSVLDPLFVDDAEEVDGYGLESSYANVQRAKHELLQKLHRFEKLAKLDPIELEKHMSEQCGAPLDETVIHEVVLSEIFKILDVEEIPTHMRRLVCDLVAEETKHEMEQDLIIRRVVSKLELWKMVEWNTIDMMVELDFRKEKSVGWKRYDEQKIRETGIDIEVAIFGVLTEELVQELVVVN